MFDAIVEPMKSCSWQCFKNSRRLTLRRSITGTRVPRDYTVFVHFWMNIFEQKCGNRNNTKYVNIISIKIKITKYEFIIFIRKKINFNLLVSSMIKILMMKIFVFFFFFFNFNFDIQNPLWTFIYLTYQ